MANKLRRGAAVLAVLLALAGAGLGTSPIQGLFGGDFGGTGASWGES